VEAERPLRKYRDLKNKRPEKEGWESSPSSDTDGKSSDIVRRGLFMTTGESWAELSRGFARYEVEYRLATIKGDLSFMVSSCIEDVMLAEEERKYCEEGDRLQHWSHSRSVSNN
jgi:hypothetical protein